MSTPTEHENEDEFELIEARIQSERPIPSPAFRGELRRSLISRLEQRSAPHQVRRLIFAYASSGAALLIVAGVGVAGLGPFAA